MPDGRRYASGDWGRRLVPQAKFLAGHGGRVDSVGVTSADQHQRALRALSQVGQLPYSQANCDVLATFAETGSAWSPQVAGLLALALVGGLIWASRN